MASGPITSWQIDGERVETVTDFIFLGSKKIACRNADITLATKVHLVKPLVFPVVMYGCESWIIKKKLNTEELMILNCGVGEDS